MSDKRLQNINVVIANETINCKIDASDEENLRRAAHAADRQWKELCKAHPTRSSHYLLATVAMGFAGLSYKKSGELEKQSALLDSLERDLDGLLMKMED